MSRREHKKNRRKKRRSFFRVFLTSIFIFTLLGFGVMYGLSILNKVDSVKIPKNDTDLGINNDAVENRDVINIALFGLDEPDAENGGRSDSIIIASLDKVHKKIKLTSIMRDTYVDIPGHQKDKINHAHGFGGPELAIKTINQNFNMNIRDFATVDFFGLESIIDTLGGLEVDIKPNEVKYVNMGVRGMNIMDGKRGKQLSDSGLQNLTGRQAVAYSRIRKTGDGDFERTERQRFVLEQVIHKGLNAGISKYPSLLNTTLPFVKTSLSKKEILSLGTFVFTSGIETVEKYRLPLNNYLLEQKINGVAYIVPNTLEDNVEALKSFIYDDIKVE
ncbi:LCP family protein [Tissierella creatinophila]|uniref:Regulatory protein MsrR n=1 Tax=Tissierella creatinophila DSM 6911 TaxID=1123403 RepID=A0A1U7M5V0_TISCR|nr:LCP family protein [Tissierella creatinophila]OLS02630.1 regulatory protein MsrR [Tissierella creatinophila DSM 6911]